MSGVPVTGLKRLASLLPYTKSIPSISIVVVPSYSREITLSVRSHHLACVCLAAFLAPGAGGPATAQLHEPAAAAGGCADAREDDNAPAIYRTLCDMPQEQVEELVELAVSEAREDRVELLDRLKPLIPAMDYHGWYIIHHLEQVGKGRPASAGEGTLADAVARADARDRAARERALQREIAKVEARRAEIDLISRKEEPLEWARAQAELGQKLLDLGSRDSRFYGEAVAAFRAALEERTRDRNPEEWADTQYSLAGALFDAGALKEAAAAYRTAIEESEPRASAYNNLGTTLLALARREPGTDNLRRAAEAYRKSAELKKDEPYGDAAYTLMGLGDALRELSRRESGTEALKDAADAYRRALEEFSRSWMDVLGPATTRLSLGGTLLELGRREGDVGYLEESVETYEEAYEFFETSGLESFERSAKAGLRRARSFLDAQR